MCKKIDNYFYADGKIYSFNFESETFDLIIDDIRITPEYVYNINNKLYFTVDTDNLVFKNSTSNLGSVVVYDNAKKRIVDTYDDIVKASFDENYLYMMLYGEKDYRVIKYDLRNSN